MSEDSDEGPRDQPDHQNTGKQSPRMELTTTLQTPEPSTTLGTAIQRPETNGKETVATAQTPRRESNRQRKPVPVWMSDYVQP